MTRIINKRGLTVITLVIVIIVAALVALSYYLSFKNVLLSPTDGNTITVLQNNQEIASTSTSKTMKLKAGQYCFKFSKSSDYQEITVCKNINESQEVVSTLLSYTASYLNGLLAAEDPGIQSALLTVDNINDYQITNKQLCVRGDWAAIRLMPNAWYDPSVPADYLPRPTNPNNTLDIVKVIAQKVDGQWQIVAGPSVVFSIEDNPSIPEEVIRAVNRLGLGLAQ